MNAQGYVALISQGKYREAVEVIKRELPFPAVLGRICPHPCEKKCSRGLIDQPIAICGLKRFVADHAPKAEPVEIEKEKPRAAIVGAGPAGLTCAYYLAREGYGVTIFESLPVVGGMLYVGIPEYRLPRDVLRKEVEEVMDQGVEIKTSTSVGQDITLDDLFSKGHKAIFLAVGAHQSLKMNIPGEEAHGVVPGVSFLREMNLGKKVEVGRRVAVIGGGNVAIDASRSALRLDAQEVTILYRRSREEMPASDEEIEAAMGEGVRITYLVAPKEILIREGRVRGIRCLRMRLGEPDTSGRRRPIPIEGSEFDVEVDMVIPAIGQTPNLGFVGEKSGIEVTEKGTIAVEPVTLSTSREGIFAGGDAQAGPGMAIDAVAAGKRAATSIGRFFRGEDLKEGREIEEEVKEWDLSDIPAEVEKEPRQEVPRLPIERRVSGFDEVETGFSEDVAVKEARRCLNCGVCCECLQCVTACKAEAVDHFREDKIDEFQVGSIILSPGFEEFDATLLGNYGYGRYPNVITSTEFERILSSSGPFEGHLQRPSDGREPHKIAWIQCVGSRDASIDRGFCSSVCCMYAIKEAILAREHSDGSL
ncbi:MAG: FAD-dependent oxidoreductase, partial [Candidatus Binatia bacterium]